MSSDPIHNPNPLDELIQMRESVAEELRRIESEINKKLERLKNEN
jgi:hypothetical protein